MKNICIRKQVREEEKKYDIIHYKKIILIVY